MYHPEAVDDDELDDLIFEYTTRPSTNLKETIREIRGSKDRDAENYDSGSLCERVLLNMPAENYTLTAENGHPFRWSYTEAVVYAPPRRSTDTAQMVHSGRAHGAPGRRGNYSVMLQLSASCCGRREIYSGMAYQKRQTSLKSLFVSFLSHK